MGSRLALVMLPLLLGGVAGGTLLASLAHSSGASASDLPVPDVPVALEMVAGSGVLATPVVGGLAMGAVAGTSTLLGGFVAAAVIVGSVALGVAPTLAEDGSSTPPPVAIDQPVETAPDDDIPVDVSLHLTGTGTPGATVSLEAAGQVYATTTVDTDGTYALGIAVPGGAASLELVQVVDTPDGLVAPLVQPLTLDAPINGVTIE